MDHLAAAAHALRDPPDRAAALEQLVLAWREHDRHPELAALVEALSAELTRALEPLDATLADVDYHTAWIARAARSTLCDLDVLLPGLFRGPLGKKIQQRFEWVLSFADDPRVTAAFGRMIEQPPVMAAANFSIWTRMFAALTRAPDIRLRSVLERSIIASSQGESQFWPMLAQRSLALLRVLPEQLPELSVALCERIKQLRERIDELAAAAPALTPNKTDQHAQLEAALLAKVYAEPHLLEHRMVWADALLSRGDPRGEFVQLQLARDDDAPPSKREKQLLSQHEPLWLGDLAAVVVRESLRWANGFPVAAEVVFDSQAQRGLIGSDVWSTFRELDCDELELITNPALRALERLGRISMPTLVALAEARGAALPIQRLGPISLTQNPPAELARLQDAEAERLAHVRELWLHSHDYRAGKRPRDFDWLFATALGQRLTSFRLSALIFIHDRTAVPPWSEWAAAHARWPKLERVRLDMGNFSLEMIERRLIVRTELGGPRSAYYLEDTQEHLAQLRGHFDQLEIVSCGAQPLPEEQAEQWAKALGSRQFIHTHQRSNETVTGSEADRALTRSQTRRRKAKSRIARAAKQTRVEPPMPRRYGPGHVGAWLVCEGPERRVHFYWGSALAFTADGSQLMVVGSHVVGLTPPDLQLAWSLRDVHRAPACSFAIEPSSQRAWIGALNGATILWDLANQRELAHSRFHRGRVNGVAIDGERMFSADVDRMLHLWRYSSNNHDDEPITLVPEQSHGIDLAVLDMALDPTATTLAVLGRDQVQWRDPNEPLRRRLTATVARATCLGWSPRGDHFVVGSEDGTITVWDLDGTQLTKLRVHQRRLAALTWTPDGTRLITAGEDDAGPTIAVIDCDTGERLLTLRSSLAGQLGAVACSTDGTLLAASAYGVATWTLPEGAPVGLWRET